jgi:hypothetical protein
MASGGSRAFGTNTSGTVYQKVGTAILTITDTTMTDAAGLPIQ